MDAESGSLSAIPPHDLQRLESLGDNCEFGFVLRLLKYEDGGLFRWASIMPDSLLATLKADFEQLYDFDHLSPMNPKMVRDSRYGTSWHTAMHSAGDASNLAFIQPEDERRRIHAREAAKLDYLVGKFRRKCEHPEPIFVIKHNSQIASDVLEAIHYQLYRRVPSGKFLLLEVREDVERAGTIEPVDRNLVRGFVRGFAPYESAEPLHFEDWINVIRAVLRLHPTKTAAKQTGIELGFPTNERPIFTDRLDCDLRAGISTLIGGNEWCRGLDGSYRLHAIARERGGSCLQWSGVYAPDTWQVQTTVQLAVPDSHPVHIELAAMDADGHVVSQSCSVTSIDPISMTLPLLAGAVMPLTLRLEAEPMRAVLSGERAVVDVDPLYITYVTRSSRLHVLAEAEAGNIGIEPEAMLIAGA